MNKVILTGNLTRDPEYKTTSAGELTSGSIAVKGYKEGEVYYFDFNVWGKRASTFTQYTSKGKKVLLEGRLQQQTWEANDGAKKSKVLINVENFEFLSPKGEASAPGSRIQNDTWDQANQDDYPGHNDDEDIPF